MKESLFLACVILIFIMFSIFLPIYDKVNGFHNVITDNRNLTWYDGRSALNFYIIKNIIDGRSISFPKNYTINGMNVENYFDLSEKEGRYYPNYSFLGNYLYASILYSFQFSSDIELFRMIILINILFFSLILTVFYFIQKSLDLKLKYRLLSTLVAGIASSLLIYNKYLFINDTLVTLLFLLLIYQILKSLKSKSIKNDIILISILSALFIILYIYQLILVFLLYFLYLSIKYKLVKSNKTYIPILIIAILLIFLISSYTISLNKIRNDSVSNDEITNFNLPAIPFGMSIFPKYVPAMDFVVYNYYNMTSVWKLDRVSNDIYAFSEQPGNAIFLSSGFYGLFGSLFGSKGFIYNSIFLIFSIFGILIYKERKSKEILLLAIVLFILIYGFLHSMWYGGVTPRYVRFFDIPILFLTFFSFYYIQEISKEKNKIKKYLVYTLFTILVILSVLNVSSLAIRADWTYEHEADLVSYDLVLWPWYPPKENILNETTILLNSAEIPKWILGGENNCKASFGSMGLVTDPCQCNYKSWAKRTFEIKNSIKMIEIKACANIAGNDGTKGFIYLDDNFIGEIFIESNFCVTRDFAINVTSGIHIIKFESGIYGNCNAEMIFWKSISFK